ncbi:MAG: NAD(P)(+) transhydrogenase (Re/Si-specific) subunit beta [Prosthecobacter sp.]|uniref:NAD(P)(+) transhydrogenase (Re/Si-specific) subunit beta n=1 Tax=Prosthecobacter sp. TaxID=1965333 RepID=UPI0025E892BA|nr:NAD(P)(+) transhydrogenase (Re/Si-specific) subunit beta [Prosthecobacter sp.]MCF7786103.1 NAD(P)(+) transhydrogenase (Re/Si-specific) subunit beta [Prosthecobacter sp.]
MITSFVFLIASVLFIVGIKLLASPKTARQGNLIAGLGMALALLAVLPQLHNSHGESVSLWKWFLILVGIVLGLVIGAAGAYKVKMTSMPQMVALFNGAGGGAAALVAAIEFAHLTSDSSLKFVISMLCAALIGAVSLSGSIIAFLKLEGRFEKPVTYPAQQLLNGLLFVVSLLLALAMASGSHSMALMILFLVIALALGVLMVMPIGGADMPVVISLLNSFTGLAVAADGFAIDNIAMIIAGTLVGSSGTLLTLAMCKAMNRPVTNVLFSAFGKVDATTSTAAAATGSVKSVQADEAALLLGMASRVVIVPGYGLAVAQAQHQVRQLADELAKKGVEVSFAIHPVAGRMPGHMNVLLAEADVPYDQLIEMESINPEMERVDVCLVIGANDVVNPAAHEDKTSPIYGMPIIEAEKAGTVIVMKRSMGKGFAGIENALFLRDNCRMLFGDAKTSLQELVTLVKDG